jgi:NifU-like protein involved in Fe-S cluster formation
VIYNELTRRHFDEPRYAGVLCQPGGVSGAAGGRSTGTWVRFDLRLAQGSVTIEEARFLAFGCPHVIAACDLICEQAMGLGAAQKLPESVLSLRTRLEAPPEKLGRLLVMEDAWLAAVRAALGVQPR